MSGHIFAIVAPLTVFSSLYLTNVRSDDQDSSPSIISNGKEDVLIYSNGYGLPNEFNTYYNKAKNVNKRSLEQRRSHNDVNLSTISYKGIKPETTANVNKKISRDNLTGDLRDKTAFYNYIASQILKYGETKFYDRNNAERVLDLKFVDGNLNISETLSNGTKINSVMKNVHQDNIISYLEKSISVIEIEYNNIDSKDKDVNTNGNVLAKGHNHNLGKSNIDKNEEFIRETPVDMNYAPPRLSSKTGKSTKEVEKGFGAIPGPGENVPSREQQSEERTTGGTKVLHAEKEFPGSRTVQKNIEDRVFRSNEDMRTTALGELKLLAKNGGRKQLQFDGMEMLEDMRLKGMLDAPPPLPVSRKQKPPVGFGSNIGPGMGSGMVPGMAPGMVPGMVPGAAPGAAPGMVPGTGYGMVPGTGYEMGPGMRPSMGFGMGSGMGPGMVPGTGYGMEPGMRPGMGIGTGSGMGPGMVPGTGYGMEPGTGYGMEPGTGYGMEPGMRPGMGIGTGSGMVPGTGYRMEPGMQPGMGIGTGSGMGPGIGPQMRPRMKSKMRLGMPIGFESAEVSGMVLPNAGKVKGYTGLLFPPRGNKDGGLTPPRHGMRKQWGQFRPAGNMMVSHDMRREGEGSNLLFPLEQGQHNTTEKPDVLKTRASTLPVTVSTVKKDVIPSVTEANTTTIVPATISTALTTEAQKVAANSSNTNTTVTKHYLSKLHNRTVNYPYHRSNRTYPIRKGKPILRILSDDEGNLTQTNTTHNMTSANVTAAPQTAVLLEMSDTVREVNTFVSKMMETYSGYFTTFAALVAQYLSQKNITVASELILAFTKELDNGGIKWMTTQFGMQMNPALEVFKSTLLSEKVSSIINYAHIASQGLISRNATLSFDINTLMSFIDSLYIPFEASKLAHVAELVHNYPNEIEYGYNARYIMNEMLKEAVLNPFMKMGTSLNKKLLVKAVASYLNEHYHYHGDDDDDGYNATLPSIDNATLQRRRNATLPRRGHATLPHRYNATISKANLTRIGTSLNKTLLMNTTSKYDDDEGHPTTHRDNVTTPNARRAGRHKKEIFEEEDPPRTIKQMLRMNMKLNVKKPNQYKIVKRRMRSTLTTRPHKHVLRTNKKKQRLKYNHPKVYDKYLQDHTTVYQHDNFEKHGQRGIKNRKRRANKQHYDRVRKSNMKVNADNRAFHRVKRIDDKNVIGTMTSTARHKTMASRAPESNKHLYQIRESKRYFSKHKSKKSNKGPDVKLEGNINAKQKDTVRNGKEYRVISDSGDFNVWSNDDDDDEKSNNDNLKLVDKAVTNNVNKAVTNNVNNDVNKEVSKEVNKLREQENNNPQDRYKLSLGQSMNFYIDRKHKIEPYLTLEKTEQQFDALRQNDEEVFSGILQGKIVRNTKSNKISPNDLLREKAAINYHLTTSMDTQIYTNRNPIQDINHVIGGEIISYTIIRPVPYESTNEPTYHAVRRSRKRKNKQKRKQTHRTKYKNSKRKPIELVKLLHNKTERIKRKHLQRKHTSIKQSDDVLAEDINVWQSDNFRNDEENKDFTDNSTELAIWHNEDENKVITKHRETLSPLQPFLLRHHHNIKELESGMTDNQAAFIESHGSKRSLQQSYNNESDDKIIWEKIYEIENRLDLNIPSRRRYNPKVHNYLDILRTRTGTGYLERIFNKTSEGNETQGSNPPLQFIEEKVNNPNRRKLLESSSYSDEEYTLKLNLEDAMLYPDKTPKHNHSDKIPIRKSIGISPIANNNRDRSNKTFLIKKIFDYIEEHENVSIR